PVRVLTRAFFGGEALKWAWLGVALWAALGPARLAPLPLLGGLLAAQLGVWLGLAGVRWARGGGGRMMAAEGPTDMTGYIKHHLEHLSSGEGFSALHLDSIFVKFLLAFVFVALFIGVARRSTSGVPGKLQCAVEMLVEYVDGLIKET